MISPLQAFFQKLSSLLQSRSRLVVVFFLMLLALSAIRFHSLNLDTSLLSLFPDSSPELAKTGELLELNPGARIMLVEFSAEEPGKTDAMREMALRLRSAMSEFVHENPAGAPGSPSALLKLLPPLFDEEMENAARRKIGAEAVTQRLSELRNGLAGPLAFAPKEYILTDPLGFIQLLLERFPSGSEDSVAALLDTDPRVSPDGRKVLLALQPLDGMNNVNAATAFMRKLDKELQTLLMENPGIAAVPVGSLRFTAENATAIERDLTLTVSLSLVFIALIYLFTVRSAGAIWLFLTPVAAVIFSGSVMSYIWPATAGLALGFGAAVLGLAEDYAVLMHFALLRNPERRAEAVGLLARPMLCSACLCMAGFSVLMFSGIPALRQLGFFAAFSLFCGLFIAILVLPCLPWIGTSFGAKVKSHELVAAESEADGLPRLRPKKNLVAFLAIFCLALSLGILWKLPFDTSFKNLGANSDALQRELTELRARWFSKGGEPLVWVSSGSTLDEALENSRELTRVLRNGKHGANQVFALSDIMPPESRQAANMERWKRFVAENAAGLAEEMETAAMAHGFRPGTFMPFMEWFDEPPVQSNRGLLKEAGLNELLWWTCAVKNGEFHALGFSESAPEVQDLPHGSIPLSSSTVTDGLNRAFAGEKKLLPLACLVCLALLAVYFRKPSLVLLASLPPLFGLCSVLAWLWLSGSGLNLAGAAALTLVIGLGADYGIVMLHELSSGLRLGAFRAIFVSGLTTLSGLGVLILAKHPVLYSLGSITFLGLCAEMAVVLLVVPMLCRKPDS